MQVHDRIVSSTYLALLSREFDARIARHHGGPRRKVPPSPKSIQPLPWRFHALRVTPIFSIESMGFTVREIGGRSHQNVYGDGRKRLYGAGGYADDDGPPPVQTYRQLVENGKPVPRDQQVREVKFDYK